MFDETLRSGILTLRREEAEFKAGYGLVKQTLPELLGHISLLHPREEEYLHSLKYDKRKHSYMLGRIACKQALSQITEEKPEAVFIDFGVFQFPVVKYIRETNMQVSITHCEDIGIAIAFPEVHPLGIDIEKINTKEVAAMEGQMTRKEKAMVSGMELPANIAYTMLWTIKEGLSKVLKTGLMTDFKCFEIHTLLPAKESYESTFTYYGQYKAISYVLSSYVFTLVLPKNTRVALEELRISLHRLIALG